jgi:hypothetical protein
MTGRGVDKGRNWKGGCYRLKSCEKLSGSAKFRKASNFSQSHVVLEGGEEVEGEEFGIQLQQTQPSMGESEREREVK